MQGVGAQEIQFDERCRSRGPRVLFCEDIRACKENGLAKGRGADMLKASDAAGEAFAEGA